MLKDISNKLILQAVLSFIGLSERSVVDYESPVFRSTGFRVDEVGLFIKSIFSLFSSFSFYQIQIGPQKAYCIEDTTIYHQFFWHFIKYLHGRLLLGIFLNVFE